MHAPDQPNCVVIEDSELLQKGYSLLLQRYRNVGCTIVNAMNGREGLDRLAQHSDCDLIILDINMPVMSGLEFLYHCKKEPAFNHIPVIISSTEDEESNIIRGLKAGAAAYLVKPFDSDDLHEIISKVTLGAESKTMLEA